MSATSNLNDNSFKSTHGSHGRRTTRIVSCNRNTSAIFGKKTFRLFLKTQKLTLLRLSFSESTEMAELLRYMARKWPSCYDIWHGNGRVVTIYGTEMAESLRFVKLTCISCRTRSAPGRRRTLDHNTGPADSRRHSNTHQPITNV